MKRYIPTMSERIQSGKWFKQRFTLIFGFLLLSCLFLGAVGLVTYPDCIAEVLGVAGTGATLAFVPIVSIGAVSDADVSPNAINAKVYLIAQDQVNDKLPFPTVNGDRDVTTIPLKDGEYMRYFMCHTYPTFLSSGSKDDGAIVMTATNTVTIVIGGFRKEIANFIETFAGKGFILIFEDCESQTKYGIGNRCKPMKFSSYEYKNDGDGKYATLTFTQTSLQQPWTYIGDIIEQDPETHTADATSLAVVSGNNQYLIPDGSAATYAINAFTGLSASDTGRLITLVGAGKTNAATVGDTSKIMLQDGATWTAKEGSQLVLRVFDGSGTVIEVSRS